MISSYRKGALCMVAAAVFWSFSGLCIKLIPWGAMSIIGLRAFLAAIVFAVYRKSVKVELTPGNLMAAGCLFCTNIFFIFANKLTTAAAAIVLQFTAPAFIILIHFIFYKKKPSLSAVIAVAVTISGMLLFFADNLETGGMLGNILAIASGMLFAGVFVCNQRPDAKPDQSMMLGFMLTALICMPFVFFGVTPDPTAWGSIIFLGIVQLGLGCVFFSIGIRRTPALLACLITAIEPILNPVWVAVVTNEVPGPYALAGGAVIITTVVAYNIWVEKYSKNPG